MRTKARSSRSSTKRFHRQTRGRANKRSYVLDRVVGNKAEAKGRADGWRSLGYLARVTKIPGGYAIWVIRR